MKQQWLDLLVKLDALSLRERAFLFLSVLACFGAVLDTLWLSPELTQHKQLMANFKKQGEELQRLRDTLKVTARPQDAVQGARAELAKLVAQTEQVNLSVRQLLPGAGQAAPLAQALVHLLRRHQGLTLVHTAALAAQAEPASNGSSTSSAVLPPGLTRQGVTMTMAGSYADLVRYVAALEAAMPAVRWGELSLKSVQGQSELTLNLFLLGERTP